MMKMTVLVYMMVDGYRTRLNLTNSMNGRREAMKQYVPNVGYVVVVVVVVVGHDIVRSRSRSRTWNPIVSS